MTAAEDNMKSKLPETHNNAEVIDSVTAAEDNMKSNLPGGQKHAEKRPRLLNAVTLTIMKNRLKERRTEPEATLE